MGSIEAETHQSRPLQVVGIQYQIAVGFFIERRLKEAAQHLSHE
jgi:hypothetical protein